MNTNFKKIWMVVLLFFGLFINALDRTNISASATVIMKDFNINAATMGIILSSFFWAYLISNIPAGLLLDKFGPKWVYGISAIIWTIATAMTGFFRSTGGMIFSRVVVGVGEAAAFPAGTKIVNENFEPKDRGTVTGIVLSGLRFGMAFAPIFTALIIVKYSWQTSFYLASIVSFVWVGLWLVTYPFGKAKNVVNSEETKNPQDKFIMRRLLKSKNIRALILIKFCLDYLFYMFVTWLPAYLIIQRHFGILKMGIYASLPWIAGAVSQPIIGVISDKLMTIGVSRTWARKAPLITVQLLAASVILTGYIESPMAAVWLLVLAVAAESAAGVMFWTLSAELAPKGTGGSLGGIVNTAGALAGILSPIITGVLVTTTGNFNSAFFVAGFLVVVATLLVLFVLGDVKAVDIGSDSKSRISKKQLSQ